MPTAIEDYALLADGRSAALVGKSGSIDWLCWPRFDSPACFAALLGTAEHGRWWIGPIGPIRRVSRTYRPGTMVLDTVFETDAGSAILTDFMAIGGGSIIRILEGRTGSVTIGVELAPRFEYGAVVPSSAALPDDTGLVFAAGPNRVTLQSDIPLTDGTGSFAIAAGTRVCFVLTDATGPLAPEPIEALAECEAYWRAWANRFTYRGPWRDAMLRSLLTLKALCHTETGGIVAAPTTSLPEHIGGERNWDYRYCWPRDSALTVRALMRAGFGNEARAWVGWLLRALASGPLRPLYSLGGERNIAERNVPWLPGYRASTPVRIGNAAAGQAQLDIYGELIGALHLASTDGVVVPEENWALQVRLVEHLSAIWNEPDQGIWEVRGGPRQFVFSKAMAWYAVDRALHSAANFGLPAPIEHWQALRDTIHASICQQGFSSARNSFTQVYEGDSVDASLLLLSAIGFLPIDDPRIQGTVATIEQDLMHDGLILRYRNADGLPSGEGVFLACSFWYADALIEQGRRGEAEALFARLVALGNDVGLFSEEYDVASNTMLGNFPQAFTHLALIETALNLQSTILPAS
ncbi:MAG: glycoside hydrolase family 15 protein [Rhodospirillales bacterium]